MQLLTKLQTIITSGTTKERGALLSEIIIVLDKNKRAPNPAEMYLLSLEGHRFVFSKRWGMTKGTNLRVNVTI